MNSGRSGEQMRRFPLWVVLLMVSSLATSCGGAQSSGQITPPVSHGILNGSTAASANSHWLAHPCGVQVELTQDGKAWTVVIDTSGTTSSGGETWTIGANANSITIGPGSGLANFFWISDLSNINGSTSSEVFSADVTVANGSGSRQDLGTCSFTLQTGPLS